MADYWYCPECNFKMNINTDICPNCGFDEYSADENWICPRCNYINKFSSKKCSNCSYEDSDIVAKIAAVTEKRNKNKVDGIVYSLDGVRGRNMTVYNNKAVLTTRAGIGSFLTGNASDGEKTIYYVDCIGVQFKRSGLQIGYIQLETASGIMNNKANNFLNENTFTFDTTVQSNEKMEKVANYIKQQIDKIKNAKNEPAPIVTNVVQQTSAADEIIKFKNLLDMGVITQEEFDEKKKQLLGL